MKANDLLRKEILQAERPRMVPDLVVKFQIADVAEIRKRFLMDRMNFYIQIVSQTNFDVFLAPGVEKGVYLLMLSMKDDSLELECTQHGLRMKLLNSYEEDVFDVTRKSEFEPFRSLQRQDICITTLRKLLDLDLLKNQKVIKEYFRMHTIAGITKIRQIWLNTPKWYWPEPLRSITEYTTESNLYNYHAITALKQYFGEKIAYYFAFSSFLTCYLFYLAIPGIVFHLYILSRSDSKRSDNKEHMYNTPVTVAWVLYVMLWNAISVERWKRKSSEINTRWGISTSTTSDIGLKNVRKEFFGDEVISHNTGSLTKKYKVNVTVITFLASLPVLIFLLCCVVGVFVGTKYLKEYGRTYRNGKYVTAFQFLASIISGVGINISNTLYSLLARWFVKKENHKYQESYERSLIFKVFTFRFLNSFIGVFYVAFVESESGEHHKRSPLHEVFILLLSLVITKECSSVMTLVELIVGS